MTDFRDAGKECDLVMKGGITSGIVYPPAILELARDYRFRNIGGTSAGAIAAAAAAAAEYGRDRDGFKKLAALAAWIGGDQHRGDHHREDHHLRDLFQPSTGTRPLMDTLFALAQNRNGAKSTGLAQSLGGLVRALLRHDRPATTRGAATGAIGGAALTLVSGRLMGGSPRGAGLVPLAIATASGGIIGGLAGGVGHLARILVKTLPANGYGLCNGRAASDAPGTPVALTDWLSTSINDLAGLPQDGTPLTFANLADRGITLRMMTTNLSQGCPYQLPFDQDLFLFKEQEMRALFPENVVRHLIAHAHPRGGRSTPPPGFHFLPHADQLPVVVATRLSLSFPLLLSAVPLYSVSDSAAHKGTLRPEDLQPNWLSDGGISSNFPIHFFDAWLPSRPTFGITLTRFPSDALTEREGETVLDPRYTSAPHAAEGPQASRAQAVELPKADLPLPLEWQPIEGLGAFLQSIFTTAQNYRDNTQAMLPSYRDRVVRIRLADSEGGLNLAMKPETIAAVAEKGRRAGVLLRDEFSFDHHRWVRFLVLMNQLEAQLEHMEQTYDRVGYEKFLGSVADAMGPPYPYARTTAWCDEALRRLKAVRELVEGLARDDTAWSDAHADWHKESFFAHETPAPEPILRVTPRI